MVLVTEIAEYLEVQLCNAEVVSLVMGKSGFLNRSGQMFL